MAKSLEQMAEFVRAGGNLEPGYAYDAGKDEVRALTADEKKAADDSVANEAATAKARARIVADIKASADAAAGPVVNAG